MEETKISLWRHQEEAIRRALPLHNYALFFDPGTGKTRTTIEILRGKYIQAGHLLRTLIFCPPIVIDNWRREWLKYSKIPPEYVTGLTGTGKQRLKALVEKGFDGELLRPHIFITNYETVQMEEVFDAMKRWKAQALVCDEAHRLKDFRRTAKRARRVLQLAEPGTKNSPEPRPHVYVLTGTPCPNSLMDIFMPFRILDGGVTFGKNFSEFRMKYFRDKNAGMPKQRHFPNWVPIEGAENDISRKMEASSMRVKVDECLDLPPVVEKTVVVEMAPEQKKLYKDMLKDYVTIFERDGAVKSSVANLAITKGLRLMQIASGYVKDDQGEEFSAVSSGWTPKQEALYQILSDMPGQKVIIWAVWRQNYEQIREVLRELGREWFEMNGELGAAKNRESARKFEESNCDMIGHPESGGEGINLVSTPVRISYSRNFSWRQMKQSDARNYRGGSEKHSSIIRINLVTEGTIEGKITEKLAKHEEITEAVLREITLPPKGT